MRTLKEWLRQHVWTSNEALVAVLDQFVTDYNERPHHGLGIPGLSPNACTKRIWLCSPNVVGTHVRAHHKLPTNGTAREGISDPGVVRVRARLRAHRPMPEYLVVPRRSW